MNIHKKRLSIHKKRQRAFYNQKVKYLREAVYNAKKGYSLGEHYIKLPSKVLDLAEKDLIRTLSYLNIEARFSTINKEEYGTAVLLFY